MRRHISAGGTSAQGQALLAWSCTFSNFAATMEACRYFGWTEATVGEPCSWGGIGCSTDGMTFSLSLRNIGLQGRAFKACPVPLSITDLCAACGMDASPAPSAGIAAAHTKAAAASSLPPACQGTAKQCMCLTKQVCMPTSSVPAPARATRQLMDLCLYAMPPASLVGRATSAQASPQAFRPVSLHDVSSPVRCRHRL